VPNPAKSDVINYVAIPVTAVVLIFAIYFLNVRQIVSARVLVKTVSTCGNKNVDIGAFRAAVDSNVYMTIIAVAQAQME
jgi:hypothetical protein